MKKLLAAGALVVALGTVACGVESTQAAPPVSESVAPVAGNEEAACQLVERALSLPAYSSRWDSVVYDAQSAAVSDEFYTEIVHAGDALFDEPMSDYRAKAQAILQNAFDKFC